MRLTLAASLLVAAALSPLAAAEFACPSDCNQQGYCHDGICVCYPGWTGDDCSQTQQQQQPPPQEPSQQEPAGRQQEQEQAADPPQQQKDVLDAKPWLDGHVDCAAKLEHCRAGGVLTAVQCNDQLEKCIKSVKATIMREVREMPQAIAPQP